MVLGVYGRLDRRASFPPDLAGMNEAVSQPLSRLDGKVFPQ